MIYSICLVLLVAVVVDFLAWIWQPPPPDLRSGTAEPAVTILVAMRNEQENLPRFLQHLFQLSYPTDKLQVLVGEDRSQDDTKELLNELSTRYPSLEVVIISKDIPNLKGKGNVVAQLIPYANNEFMFITDADVRVPATWIHSLLKYSGGGVGVIGGSTVVVGSDVWSRLQNLDWLLAQSLLAALSCKYRTVAVSGTNMMITQSACKAIGGYEKIPYSLTEDIGFLTAANAQGIKAVQVWEPEATAEIKAQKDLGTLLKQRSRWTYGATKLPLFVVVLLLFRTLFLPLTVWLALLAPMWALGFYLVRFTLQGMLIGSMAQRLGREKAWWLLGLFELYYTLVSLGGLILYLLPVKFSWKGRTY